MEFSSLMAASQAKRGYGRIFVSMALRRLRQGRQAANIRCRRFALLRTFGLVRMTQCRCSRGRRLGSHMLAAHAVQEGGEMGAEHRRPGGGTRSEIIPRPAPAVEKAGAQPGHGPNKGEGK